GFSEFAVLFLDLKGSVQNWSLGARRLLGYESSAVLGKSVSYFFSEEDDLNQKVNQILEAVQTHGRSENELWLYRDDGSSFWGKLLAATVNSENGVTIGYSVVLQDVTKEKSAEEELKAMKSSAETANKAKTAFLANISHEIRTPLGAVLGFAELMSQPRLKDEAKLDLFGKVKRNGEQLTTLINDLLDISKIEAGKIDIETIETDLETLLFDVVQLFAEKASEANVTLTNEVLGAVPKVIWTDPTRLRQIAINLIGNALKFTSAGGTVKVEVSLHQAPQGQSIAIRVIDNGRGMSEGEMGRLFMPFVQADVSTTREFGGTGLGLFLSKRLAKALGGDLSIESSFRGLGSTFIVHINPGPFDPANSFTRIARPNSATALALTASEDLKGVKVLVVDDSADNRELIRTYLIKAGAEVTTEVNGDLGAKAALAEDYDVVLMDIQMPVLDGNQAMINLQQSGYTRPVIALTAHAMREEKHRSLNNGFTDYLTKPIDRKNLIQRIREILAGE
ncbi:MAG: PAS domain-containing hybrid sensor histidine kinase/response regulator, partial [Proteobacteria bacterium]